VEGQQKSKEAANSMTTTKPMGGGEGRAFKAIDKRALAGSPEAAMDVQEEGGLMAVIGHPIQQIVMKGGIGKVSRRKAGAGITSIVVDTSRLIVT